VNFPLSLVIELVIAAVGLVDVGVVGIIGVEDGRAEVYARTEEMLKYALSYRGLPGPTTQSWYCITSVEHYTSNTMFGC
jgi:hypothetical protein